MQELEHVKGMSLCAYLNILKHEYKEMKQKENRGRIRKMNQNGTNERKKKTIAEGRKEKCKNKK